MRTGQHLTIAHETFLIVAVSRGSILATSVATGARHWIVKADIAAE